MFEPPGRALAYESHKRRRESAQHKHTAYCTVLSVRYTRVDNLAGPVREASVVRIVVRQPIEERTLPAMDPQQYAVFWRDFEEWYELLIINEGSIMQVRASELTDDQRFRIRAVTKHLLPATPRPARKRNVAEVEAGDGDDEDEELAQPQRARFTHKSSNKPQERKAGPPPNKRAKEEWRWKALLGKVKSARDLKPPLFLTAHLKKHGNAPDPFFTVASSIKHKLDLPKDFSSMVAISNLLMSAKQFSERIVGDKTRLFFLCLGIYDTCIAIDQRSDRQRPPPEVRARFGDVVTNVQQAYQYATEDCAWRHIRRMMCVGKKLDVLYRRCEPGSIFLLAEYLSCDILVKRTPKQGTNETIEYLRNTCEIASLAAPYSALAANLRRRLTDSFREALHTEGGSMPASTGEEDADMMDGVEDDAEASRSAEGRESEGEESEDGGEGEDGDEDEDAGSVAELDGASVGSDFDGHSHDETDAPRASRMSTPATDFGSEHAVGDKR
ncbi:hypothetical protein LTR74_003358 [Friedmanniomyces endolithicus]|nr:hypothetical protein LTR74_003358 [Friedmanniomyces endolithicus]